MKNYNRKKFMETSQSKCNLNEAKVAINRTKTEVAFIMRGQSVHHIVGYNLDQFEAGEESIYRYVADCYYFDRSTYNFIEKQT